MIQTIKYKCCGKIFAACYEPDCYTDKDWLKNLKEYVNRGDIVGLTDEKIQFGKCECNKSKQQKLL